MIFHPEQDDFFRLICRKTGKPEKTCAYEDLTEKAKMEFDYLLDRAERSIHPILKSRYYHVLWKCPSKLKRKDFAQKAISNYFATIDVYLNILKTGIQEEILSLVGENFGHLNTLVMEVNEPREELNLLFRDLLWNHINIPFYEKDHLVSLTLKHPKLFDKESLNTAFQVYEQEFFKNFKKNDAFLIIHEYIPNALNLAKRLKINPKKWFDLLGNFHYESALQDTDPTRSWIRLDNIRQARLNFKRAKNEEKLALVETLYEESRLKVDLPSTLIQLTREKHKHLFEFRDQKIEAAKELVRTKDADFNYTRLISGIDFPSAKPFDEEDNKYIPDFFRGTRTIFFDITNNTSEGDEEIEKNVIKLDFYKLELDFNTNPFLEVLYTEGVRSSQLTADNLLNFLRDRTWLGQPYYILDQEQNQHALSWLSLLEPSLREFYSQLELKADNQEHRLNFILCLDSIVPKFEGLLRYFLQQCGKTVSVTIANRVEQMTLNKMLESEGFTSLFNRDDQMLFQYLFGGAGGLDIRNNIAHSFYHSHHYNLKKMLLVIGALLRLSKYRLRENEKTS
ncbi:DUF4209 domain-containing protein [Litoribacter ruber]|uniref:DUF4209 domain-containing protein n=1 Tax=Litoribacter ruber TaxID=702568 RepID=UPI001BDA6504|nr:DUF4209 domain-containing protein [Litoribacter ruber]MBT0810097.1 DUF4209 domain-containing protein [Litoribacter ruber]